MSYCKTVKVICPLANRRRVGKKLYQDQCNGGGVRVLFLIAFPSSVAYPFKSLYDLISYMKVTVQAGMRSSADQPWPT